jgi:hypothetical protein
MFSYFFLLIAVLPASYLLLRVVARWPTVPGAGRASYPVEARDGLAEYFVLAGRGTGDELV